VAGETGGGKGGGGGDDRGDIGERGVAGDALAFTGANIAGLGLMGLVLIGSGLALQLRRRLGSLA
jgi:hypothetical protein